MLLRSTLFILIFLWLAGVFSELLLHVSNVFSFLRFFTGGFYSAVCHQNPSKVIEYGGFSTLVCARCLGIYFGALSAALLNLFRKINLPDVKLFYFASLIMFTDVVFVKFSVYSYNKNIAFLSGIFWGMILFAYISVGLSTLIHDLRTVQEK